MLGFSRPVPEARKAKLQASFWIYLKRYESTKRLMDPPPDAQIRSWVLLGVAKDYQRSMQDFCMENSLITLAM